MGRARRAEGRRCFVTRLLHKLSTRLDAAGYGDVRFLGPNTANLGAGVSDYIPSLMSDPVVMGRIDHLGLHSYGASTGGADAMIKSSRYRGRNFWMTEFSLPGDVGNLLAGNASALIMWDGYDSVYNHAILGGHGDQPPNDAGNGPAPLSYDNRTGTFAARPEFYQFAALFKYRPARESARPVDLGQPGSFDFRLRSRGTRTSHIDRAQRRQRTDRGRRRARRRSRARADAGLHEPRDGTRSRGRCSGQAGACRVHRAWRQLLRGDGHTVAPGRHRVGRCRVGRTRKRPDAMCWRRAFG